MKLALSSDNHLDINRVDEAQVLVAQAQYLVKHGIDYYLFLGDMYNDFTKTVAFIHRLQTQVAGRVQIRYLLGNHDMLKNISYPHVDNFQDPLYLHGKIEDLPYSNVRLIGNNGWYDYSFSQNYGQQEIKRWKNVFWVDGAIDQDISDIQRENRTLTVVKEQLIQAQADHKKVFFVTHFAPQEANLWRRPTKSEVSDKMARHYEMMRAMYGSQRLGDLLQEYANVKWVGYGHLHGQHADLTLGSTSYYHAAVGVKKKRRNEWQAPTFMAQWQKQLQIFEI